MSNFYYNMMNYTDQRVYKKALNGVKNYNTRISVGRISNDRFVEIVIKMKYDHPEFFYVDFSQIITAYDSITGLIWNICYRFPAGLVKQKTEEIENKIQRILSRSKLTSNSTVVEKCRWIHNTLVRNVEYDYNALQNAVAIPEAHNIQGVFEKKKAVCEGISLAVVFLGDRLGLDVGFVPGKGISEHAELNTSHCWNVINVGKGYAHMDVTWDMCLSRELCFTKYDYFLVPDKEIEIDHIMEEKNIKAEVSGYSFFELTGRDFTTFRQCSEYICKVLKNKKTSFYFRFRTKVEPPEQSDINIQSLIMRKATSLLQHNIVLIKSHNLDKGIFYYKIQEC